MLAPTESWPPSYKNVLRERTARWLAMRDATSIALTRRYYKIDPVEFINTWVDTHDPRNGANERPTRMPFVLFKRQRELVEFVHGCVKTPAHGLIEKSRDMGATWCCAAYSVWLWLFHENVSIGWGSRHALQVDRLGVIDSIFEKMRVLINYLPKELLPKGFSPDKHLSYMRIVNPENGSVIAGECGDNIGRGGRTLVYFKDEAAHYEHPEAIEAALMDNTRCQIDVSSVNGLGNVFHRRRENGVDWESGHKFVKDRANVFVMDWRDHPEKTQQWYDERKQKMIGEGLLHKFAQEVDRNYAASVEGTIIPHEWLPSAIDAHLKIKGDWDSGQWVAGLDVADGGGDRNALAKRRGVVLRFIEEWGERDTGVTTRRCLSSCSDTKPIEVQYDCVGVGAGVKAESNRLADDKFLPRGIRLVPWDAGSGVLLPDRRVVDGDRDSPLNKDFYANLKAQAWWNLRRRFERTHRALTEGIKYPVEDMISIDSTLPRLRQLEKELCQPTASRRTGNLKLVVDKMPEGTRSPNLADAVVMCYFPARQSAYISDLSWAV